MSRKFCLTAVAVVAASFAMTSAASANWTTNGSAGGSTSTSHTTRTSVFSISAFGAIIFQRITCTTSHIHIVVFGPSLASGFGLASLVPSFSGTCQVVGQTAAVKCGNASFNGQSYTPAANVTSGSLTGISCVIAKTSGACGNATTFTGGGITVTGSVNGSYGNTSQQLTVDTAGQTLKASWNSAGCLQGTGTGSATAAVANSTGTALSYDVTSTFKPQITN
jgi:hypothetical protein